MTQEFFQKPILNSPYDYPDLHWELDETGQPTNRIVERRRRADFITPIPKPKKRKQSDTQREIVFDEGKGLSTEDQQYDPTPIINRAPTPRRRVATDTQSRSMAGNARDRSPAPTLEKLQVQQHQTILLPG